MQRPLAQSGPVLLKVEQGINTRNRVKLTAGAILPQFQEGPWVGPAGSRKLSPVGEWESQLQVTPSRVVDTPQPPATLSSGN